VVMGLFGISEVLLNLERRSEKKEFFKTRLKELLPNRKDWRDSAGPITRASVVGFFLGLLPGGGGIIPSFISYAMAKRIAKDPEKFGTGDIRGVAAPETANNAGAGGTFIPLLTLGIPCNAVLAVLLGALMIHGVTPGPLLMKNYPDLFWGVVGSMYIGNIMLLVLNLPLIGLWVQVLRVPYVLLFPLIFLFCIIGAYSLNNSLVDVTLMLLFGVMGYFMQKFAYDPSPLVLSLVLGPMFEEALSQSLVLSQGNPMIFFSRPISASFLILSLAILISPLILSVFKKKRPVLSIEGQENL
jgi:putative tricarboxylic transport membrane protein